MRMLWWFCFSWCCCGDIAWFGLLLLCCVLAAVIGIHANRQGKGYEEFEIFLGRGWGGMGNGVLGRMRHFATLSALGTELVYTPGILRLPGAGLRNPFGIVGVHLGVVTDWLGYFG